MIRTLKAALVRCGAAALAVAALLGVASTAWAQTTSGGTGGFVPANQLPPAQLMPAAPLLIGAYAFVWVALLFYLWTIWRRLTKMDGELKKLESRK